MFAFLLVASTGIRGKTIDLEQSSTVQIVKAEPSVINDFVAVVNYNLKVPTEKVRRDDIKLIDNYNYLVGNYSSALADLDIKYKVRRE